MSIDLDELERKAKAATPGPWIAGDDEDSDFYLVGPHQYGLVSNAVVKTHDVDNAEFIAAVNPSVAQELINRLREAEKDAERLSFAYSQRHTNSMELVDLEMRLINGDNPSIEEVRMAIDDAMEQEQNNG